MDFKEEFHQGIHRQYTTSMIKMLDRCPKLEDLHIFPYHPTYLDTTQLFERGRWPSLKRFTLRRMSEFGDGVLNTFIEAHPKLERLFIDTDDHESPNARRVWTACTPDLKALHAGLQWDMIKIMSTNNMRQLEFLSVVDMGADSVAIGKHLQILTRIPTLQSIVVDFPQPSPELLGRFAEAIPSIKRLHFRFGTFDGPLRTLNALDDQNGVSLFTSISCICAQSYTIMQIFRTRLNFISRLRSLTHLSYLIQVDANTNNADGLAIIDAIVRRIARASGTLRYLHLLNTRMVSFDWITIERDEEGTFTGWHFAGNLPGLSPEVWGGFFLGASRPAVLGF